MNPESWYVCRFDPGNDIGVQNENGCLDVYHIPIHNIKFDDDATSKMITHYTHESPGADATALWINYASQWIYKKMNFMDIVDDHKLGEGGIDCFNKCVVYAVERICIWDISKALKWGKVLMQIFPDPRGSRFLAHTGSFVRWYDYGCGRTWWIVRWCGYGYDRW